MAKDKPKHRRKDRIGLSDAIVPAAVTILLAEPDPDLGGDSALTKVQYALDAADQGAWTDPDTGFFANLSMAGQAATNSIVSLDGAVTLGLAVGARHVVKHSHIGRKVLFRSRHHVFTAG